MKEPVILKERSVSLRSVSLQKLEFATVACISKKMLDAGWIDPKLVSWYDAKADEMYMKMSALLFSETIPTDVKVMYPANWWEHFKKRWLPWAGYRTITVVFSVEVIYPELVKKLSLPKEKHFILARQDKIDPTAED